MLWWGIIFTDTCLMQMMIAFLWEWRCCRWRKLSMIYRYTSQCSKMILMMLSSWCYWWCSPLSPLMLLKNTLLVNGECWNNVTAKCILIIIWYIIHWINPHCGLIMLGYCKRKIGLENKLYNLNFNQSNTWTLIFNND